MHRSERLAELVATLRCGQTVRLNLDGKTRDWEVATLYKRKCALWDVTRKKRVFVCYGRIFAKQLRFHHFRHWEVLVRWHGEVVKCLGVSEQTNGKVRITDGPSELVGRVIADRLQLAVNDWFVVHARGQSRRFRVAAIYETGRSPLASVAGWQLR